MINEIKPLQSSDQNRLREQHKQGGQDAFARYMRHANDEPTSDDVSFQAERKPVAAPSLIRRDGAWASFFAQLDSSNANDAASDPTLFNWGETRANARQHVATARQTASLKGDTPLHILNEKI